MSWEWKDKRKLAVQMSGGAARSPRSRQEWTCSGSFQEAWAAPEGQKAPEVSKVGRGQAMERGWKIAGGF